LSTFKYFVLHFRLLTHVCYAYSTSRSSSEHDDRLSVCPSVTLVDCDHMIMQRKVEIGIWQDKSASWLSACGSRPRS